ncbi:MAG: cysteine synthase family protein [Myxococcales bacterium]|nr:cysteine synthase family protein [Myxococcales bacterium]
MAIASSITDLIGNTPLLALDRFAAGCGARLVGKMEMFNPVSIKDRPVWSMIRRAEDRGDIRAGDTLVEATSGNTGMALTYLGVMRGYKVQIFMSEAQSVERRNVLAALGATIMLTPKAEGTKGARDRAIAFAEAAGDKPGENAFYLCQHHNLDNRRAHYETTGPELWKSSEGEIDAVVAGLGTCGTLSGISAFIKERKPAFRAVGVEPKGAALISKGEWAPHGIMGTSPGFVAENLDRELVDEVCTVSEEEAYQACRELAAKEGILVGISSGASAWVARRLANRPQFSGKLIACIIADTGERYLSVPGLFGENRY